MNQFSPRALYNILNTGAALANNTGRRFIHLCAGEFSFATHTRALAILSTVNGARISCIEAVVVVVVGIVCVCVDPVRARIH